MKMLFTAAVALDCSLAQAFTAAVRHGRPDLAEVCCTPESALSSTITELEGVAQHYDSVTGPAML